MSRADRRALLVVLGIWLLLVAAFCAELCAETHVNSHDTFPLPTILDDDIQAALHDERTVFYDERVVPRAYQHNGASFHSAYNNISADHREPFGNANRELPWDETAGAGENVYSVKFVHLPEGRKIAYYIGEIPVVTTWSVGFGRPLAYGGEPRMLWVYPSLTIIGELLYKRLPDGQFICFELRVRQKIKDTWEASVFRPFPECEDMIAWLESRDKEQHGPLIDMLKRRRNLRSERVSDRFHRSRMVINRVYHMDVLPVFPADLQLEMSKAVFENATGDVWYKDAAGNECYAPAGGLAPLDYRGTMAGNQSESCIVCHRTTSMHVSHFQKPRDWYGSVRGSDTVFSLQPKHRTSTNGFNTPGEWNPRVAHLFEPYDPRRHPRDVYTLVGGR